MNAGEGTHNLRRASQNEICADWGYWLDINTGLGLLNAVLWHNYNTLGIQGIKSHYDLRAEDFKIHSPNDAGGPMALHFIPSKKCVIERKHKAAAGRRQIFYSHTDQEVFDIYRKYLSNIKKPGKFYRFPVDMSPMGPIRYSDKKPPKKQLSEMLKNVVRISRQMIALDSVNMTQQAGLATGDYWAPMAQPTTSHSDFPQTSGSQDIAPLNKPFVDLTQLNRNLDMNRSFDDDGETGQPYAKLVKGEIPAKNFDSPADRKTLQITVPSTIDAIAVTRNGEEVTFHLD